MARCHFRHSLTDQLGNAIQNAALYIYQPGTTTAALGSMYAAQSGGSAITNPLLTDNEGEAEAWLDTAQSVDVLITSNSGAAYLASSPLTPLAWTSYTEHDEVRQAPEDVIGGSGAPTTASYVTTATEAGLSAETVLGTGVIIQGTHAARLALSQPVAGVLFDESDTGAVFRSDGAAWTAFAYHTITDAVHGVLGSNLHADAHPNVHAMSVHSPGAGTPVSTGWANAGGGGTGYADDKHIHDATDQQASRVFQRATALYETVDRSSAANQAPLTSGVIYCVGIYLPVGVIVTSVTFMGGSTAESGGSHCWAGIADANRVIKAVSVDNTGATFFSPINIEHTFTMVPTYTTTAEGIYYLFLCVVGTVPTLAARNTSGPLGLLAPTITGAANTAMTVPLAVGVTLAAFTQQSHTAYAYVS